MTESFGCKFLDIICNSHNGHNTGNCLLTPPVEYSVDASGTRTKLPLRITFPYYKRWLKSYVPTNQSHKAGVLFEKDMDEKDVKGMGTVRWNAKFENHWQKDRLGWGKMKEWSAKLVAEGLCERSAGNLYTFLNDEG